MEILKLKDYPWFVGVQFHPEYLSRVLQPSRPYLGFVAAASGCLERISKETMIADECWGEWYNQREF
jgi:CTP synthase